MAESLLLIDKIVAKKYVSILDEAPVYIQNYDVNFDEKEISNEYVINVGSNVRMLKLCRIVYDEEENILDKLTTVYNATSSYENAILFMLLRSDKNGVTIYLGTVCNDKRDEYLPGRQIDALKDNFMANFPGSELIKMSNEKEKNSIIRDVFYGPKSIASVVSDGINTVM